MTDFVIPDDLAQMISERRVIPFIGSGFSSGLGLPQWHELLEKICQEVGTTVKYSDIRASCADDPLQIAEYLYIEAGNSIGPLRYAITKHLHNEVDMIHSTPHVELVNLGAPQIYTTNYDDLIEDTYHALGIDVDVIVLPRHVAISTNKTAQIVKYHGDLRHDDSLVLTESQYYTRLDLESPVDLKFRSDLLGKSVLFIGYSFSDLNIRVIWFKLMRMMRDVPESDRPPSYIVRLQPDPVKERLYEAVGLRTIVIDPTASASTPAQQTALLASFLTALSSKAAPDSRIPGQERPMYVSAGMLEAIDEALGPPPSGSTRSARGSLTVPPLQFAELVDRLVDRELPPQLVPKWAAVVDRIGREIEPSFFPPTVAMKLMRATQEKLGISPGVTLFAVRGLFDGFMRRYVLDAGLAWDKIWNAQIGSADAMNFVVKRLDREVQGHRNMSYSDPDIAYVADIARRIQLGTLAKLGSAEVEELNEYLSRASTLYPPIGSHQPDLFGPPDVSDIVQALPVRDEEPWGIGDDFDEDDAF